ncbi:MAG: hypothetical protein ACI9WR_001211, partial [Paracoccaceae bacterium]
MGLIDLKAIKSNPSSSATLWNPRHLWPRKT